MGESFPRRSLFQLAGAAALLRSRVAAQQAPSRGQAPAVRVSLWQPDADEEG